MVLFLNLQQKNSPRYVGSIPAHRKYWEVAKWLKAAGSFARLVIEKDGAAIF